MAPKAALRPAPDARAFSSGSALAHFHRRVALCYFHNLGQLIINLGVIAFNFDNQKRLAIGVASICKGFAGANAGPVHELNCHRQQNPP